MSLPKDRIHRIARKIRMIALDVDGVMTDGIITMNPDGTEAKGFHVRDGFGIILAKRAGLEFSLITGRLSSTVEHRARQLEIEELHGGFVDKRDILTDILKRHNLKWDQAAYMGDDLFDLPVLRKVGLSAAPADACEEVLAEVKWVSGKPGGYGAVRELIELIMKSQDLWDSVTDKFTGN